MGASGVAVRLRDVHRQIREQGARRDYANDVKLGRGGIREIEFIVQALQIVRGGFVSTTVAGD